MNEMAGNGKHTGFALLGSLAMGILGLVLNKCADDSAEAHQKEIDNIVIPAPNPKSVDYFEDDRKKYQQNLPTMYDTVDFDL